MSLRSFAFVLPLFAFLLSHQTAAQALPGASKDTSGATSANPALTNSDSPSSEIVSTTNLVLVPVILADKRGKPLNGVDRRTFRLEENGKEQRIAVFEEVKGENTDSGPPQTVSAQGALNSAAGEAKGGSTASGLSQMAGEHEVTNIVSQDLRPSHMTIVVLDMLNTPLLRQGAAKLALINYLSQTLKREEPTALFGLNSEGLHELHSFTVDAAVLIAALKKVKGEYTQGEMNDSVQEMADTMTTAQQNMASSTAQQISIYMNAADSLDTSFYQRQIIETTLEAFEQLALAYQTVPGRKTVIWASAGFPFMIDDPQAFGRNGLDMMDQYEKTWRALMSANMAVYPIDVQGVINSSFMIRNVAGAASNLGPSTGGAPGTRGPSSGSGAGNGKGGGGAPSGGGGGGGGAPGGSGGGGAPGGGGGGGAPGGGGGGGAPGGGGGGGAPGGGGTGGWGSSPNGLGAGGMGNGQYDKQTEEHMTLRAIANATGGLPCLNSNDLEGCYANAVDDSRNYYLLGFYLSPEDKNPGWRKLKVKVALDGARVRYREGFYVSAPLEDTAQSRFEQINDALLSPVAYTGVRLAVSPLGDETTAQGKAVQASASTEKRTAYFKLTITGDNFVVNRADNNVLDLVVAAMAFDKKGNAADQDAHNLNVKLSTAKISEFAQKGLTVRQGLKLAPGSYEVRFAVRNNSTGQIGTVMLPFERH